MRKRTIVIALAVAGVVFATVFALAATMSVGSNNLAAGSGGVGACDPDGVSSSYANTWDATDKRYEVTGVTVGGINNNCDAKTVSVSLTDASGAQIGSGTVTVPTDTLAFTATVTLSTAASAELTEGVHVTIA